MDIKQTANKQSATGKNGVQVKVDWTVYTKNFVAVPRGNLFESLSGSLLQLKPAFNEGVIKSNTDSSNRESFIKSATIQMMSTPEYQLC